MSISTSFGCRYHIDVGDFVNYNVATMKSSDQGSADTFPQRLRQAREIREMTQAELAQKAKLPATSISHLEAGSRKPSFDNLRRLATALDLSTDYLLGRVDSITDYAPDTLYRDIQKLTESDREMIRRFASSLGEKGETE